MTHDPGRQPARRQRMTQRVTRRLVQCYPSAFRDHWGAAVADEATSARSWPNLAVGIVDMWLHPTIWPARSGAQRLRRASVLAITVTAACWYLAHLDAEMAAPSPNGIARAHGMNVCAAVTILGLLLVAPRPRLTTAALAAVARTALRLFTLPTLLGAGLIAATRHDHLGTVPWPVRLSLLAAWYLTLALGACQLCRFVAQLGPTELASPHPWRLRLGIRILTASAVASGLLIFGLAVADRIPDPFSAFTGIGVLALASAFLGTLRDLRQLPAISN